jgi:hypothetical protein
LKAPAEFENPRLSNRVVTTKVLQFCFFTGRSPAMLAKECSNINVSMSNPFLSKSSRLHGYNRIKLSISVDFSGTFDAQRISAFSGRICIRVGDGWDGVSCVGGRAIARHHYADRARPHDSRGARRACNLCKGSSTGVPGAKVSSGVTRGSGTMHASEWRVSRNTHAGMCQAGIGRPRALGRADGFDEDKTASERDEGAVFSASSRSVARCAGSA